MAEWLLTTVTGRLAYGRECEIVRVDLKIQYRNERARVTTENMLRIMVQM